MQLDRIGSTSDVPKLITARARLTINGRPSSPSLYSEANSTGRERWQLGNHNSSSALYHLTCTARQDGTAHDTPSHVIFFTPPSHSHQIQTADPRSQHLVTQPVHVALTQAQVYRTQRKHRHGGALIPRPL